MNKHYEHCPLCNKEVFFNEDFTISFEDFNRTIVHDQFKCYNFKHYKKLFEKLEDDIQKVKEDCRKIQEVLF